MADVTVVYRTQMTFMASLVDKRAWLAHCAAAGPLSCQLVTISPCLLLPTSQWDAFSIPELQNFLTILEKEEQDKLHQLQKKYNKFRQKLEEALRESQGKPG